MLFPTIQFAVFFLLVLVASWLLMQRPVKWKPFMLAASYVFYGAWDWRFVGLLFAVTVVTQVGAVLINRVVDDRRRRRLLVMTLVFDLGLLAWFKYYGFFASSLANLLSPVGLNPPLPLLQVILPVGISFFTFQAISYVVDIYRGTFKPGRLIDFAVFLSFFPHVVAGPIVRPAEFMPQLKARHDPRHVDASRAFFLIFIGLFKKVVIANLLATEIVDATFASPQSHSSLEMLVGVYAYAVQIYADFSGYTDMAIGIALLLGFRFPQNFDSPYAAQSIQDFWRRWHMTLSRWLRDYLYIPLGGNRGGSGTTYRNLMLTMVLGGLWHGAAWTFVIWGSIHGTYLCVDHWRHARRLRLNLPEKPDTIARRTAQRIITFNLVCFAWIFFRSESLDNAFDVLRQIFDPSQWFQPAPLVTAGVIAAIAVGLIEQYIPRAAWGRAMARFSYFAPVVQGLVLGVALLLINTMGPRGVAPFIYFRF